MKRSEGHGLTLLHEHMSIRELYSKWVPRSLTLDQKQERIVYWEIKSDFFVRYVTMHETWIHHCIAKRAKETKKGVPFKQLQLGN